MTPLKRKILLAASIATIFVILAINAVFKVSSNVSFFFNQESRLLLKSEGRWIYVDGSASNRLLLKNIYQADGVNIDRINIRRENRPALRKIWELVLPPKVMVFEFSPENSFFLIAKTEDNLSPINSREAKRKRNADFVVNTSFYGTKGEFIGELIINRQVLGRDNGISSGFFKVVNGKPRVGPRSSFANMRGEVSYSCQAHPSVMRNGTLFHYIISERPPYHHTWKRKTYRNLIGEKENGNIVFILSNRGALLSVKEIASIAQQTGVNNASLFDGGAALQYRFRHKGRRISFSAINNFFSVGRRFEDYFERKTNTQFKQKSPVFLGIKISEPSE